MASERTTRAKAASQSWGVAHLIGVLLVDAFTRPVKLFDTFPDVSVVLRRFL